MSAKYLNLNNHTLSVFQVKKKKKKKGSMKKATVSAHNSITQCETEITKVFQYGPENSNNNNNKPYMSAWQVRIE